MASGNDRGQLAALLGKAVAREARLLHQHNPRHKHLHIVTVTCTGRLCRLEHCTATLTSAGRRVHRAWQRKLIAPQHHALHCSERRAALPGLNHAMAASEHAETHADAKVQAALTRAAVAGDLDALAQAWRSVTPFTPPTPPPDKQVYYPDSTTEACPVKAAFYAALEADQPRAAQALLLSRAGAALVTDATPTPQQVQAAVLDNARWNAQAVTWPQWLARYGSYNMYCVISNGLQAAVRGGALRSLAWLTALPCQIPHGHSAGLLLHMRVEVPALALESGSEEVIFALLRLAQGKERLFEVFEPFDCIEHVLDTPARAIWQGSPQLHLVFLRRAAETGDAGALEFLLRACAQLHLSIHKCVSMGSDVGHRHVLCFAALHGHLPALEVFTTATGQGQALDWEAKGGRLFRDAMESAVEGDAAHVARALLTAAWSPVTPGRRPGAVRAAALAALRADAVRVLGMLVGAFPATLGGMEVWKAAVSPPRGEGAVLRGSCVELLLGQPTAAPGIHIPPQHIAGMPMVVPRLVRSSPQLLRCVDGLVRFLAAGEVAAQACARLRSLPGSDAHLPGVPAAVWSCLHRWDLVDVAEAAESGVVDLGVAGDTAKYAQGLETARAMREGGDVRYRPPPPGLTWGALCAQHVVWALRQVWSTRLVSNLKQCERERMAAFPCLAQPVQRYEDTVGSVTGRDLSRPVAAVLLALVRLHGRRHGEVVAGAFPPAFVDCGEVLEWAGGRVWGHRRDMVLLRAGRVRG